MRRLPGIASFAAEVRKREVSLSYERATVSEEAIRQALEAVGYESTVLR